MKKFFAFLQVSALSLGISAQVDQTKIEAFIKAFSETQNVPEAEVRVILGNATFQPTIIEKISRPAEGTMTWERYRSIFMKEDRINLGIAFWEEHEKTLTQVSQEYGIPVEIILGIIGVETKFGTIRGNYKVLDALYTLAFGYPKRSKFFTSELDHFLVLAKEQNLDINQIKGSYAGAIGYCQFMPSSYRAYAKNFGEDPSIDLYNSPQDAIASAANYLKVHRWQRGNAIMFPMRKSASATNIKSERKPSNYYGYYANLGYTSQESIPEDLKLLLIRLKNEDSSEYWLGTQNFYAITRYNHSPMYATVVYQLGEAIKSGKN